MLKMINSVGIAGWGISLFFLFFICLIIQMVSLPENFDVDPDGSLRTTSNIWYVVPFLTLLLRYIDAIEITIIMLVQIMPQCFLLKRSMNHPNNLQIIDSTCCQSTIELSSDYNELRYKACHWSSKYRKTSR